MEKAVDTNELVSVIITTINRDKYLKECLDSIVSQTYTNIEIFVIDDGSNETISIKNKEISDNFLKCNYYFKTNTGQPDSRNFGIKLAKGKYLAFCDDDDFWVLDKLEKQVAVLENNSDYGVVNGSIEYVNKDGTKTGKIRSHKGHNHGLIFKDLLVKNRTASITPLLRKEVFKKVGLFNPSFTIGEDWEFWRRVSYYYQFFFIDEVLACVRLHGENMSDSRTESVLERYILYKKITKSLLDWGKKRFDKKEINHIKYIEWCFYRKLFTNNLLGFSAKLKFLKDLFLNDFNDLFRLLRLYIKHNKDYKNQI